MCAAIDGRSAVQRHILEHLGQYVAIRTSEVDGELIDLGNGLFGPGPIWQSLYVHPRTGLLRRNSEGVSWHRRYRGRLQIANESVPIAGVNSPPAANCTGLMGNRSSWISPLCRRHLRRCGMRCGAVVSRKEQARHAARRKRDMRSSSSVGPAFTPPRSVSWRQERCATMGFSTPHNPAPLKQQKFWSMQLFGIPVFEVPLVGLHGRQEGYV